MSSKRRIRRKQCDGKIQYQNSEEGKKALLCFKRRMKDHSAYNIYKCDFCKKYHIGHRKW